MINISTLWMEPYDRLSYYFRPLLNVFTRATFTQARSLLQQRGWLSGWVGVCLTLRYCLNG